MLHAKCSAITDNVILIEQFLRFINPFEIFKREIYNRNVGDHLQNSGFPSDLPSKSMLSGENFLIIQLHCNRYVLFYFPVSLAVIRNLKI